MVEGMDGWMDRSALLPTTKRTHKNHIMIVSCHLILLLPSMATMATMAFTTSSNSIGISSMPSHSRHASAPASAALYYGKRTFDDSSSSSSSPNSFLDTQGGGRSIKKYTKKHQNKEQARMEMVRQLQNVFYQNETSMEQQMEHNFGFYDNMPVLRSERVELPGFQSLWNITDPLEIHMFLKVIHSTKSVFGHLYKRDDTTDWYGHYDTSTHVDMNGNPIAQEQHQEQPEEKYNVGTLMQVSDYRQDTETGHLLVLVQALARFVVVGGSTERWDWMDTNKKQHTYKPTVERASVELLPDEEFVHYFRPQAQATADSFDFSRNRHVQGAACAGAIAEASQWRFFETQPQCIPLPGGQALDPVASLSSSSSSSSSSSVTDIVNNAQLAMQEYLSQSPMELHPGECSLYDEEEEEASASGASTTTNKVEQEEHVLSVERSVWLELDKLVKHLSELNPKANTQMPIPTQILSLMPYEHTKWPNDFSLAKYVQQLARAHSILARNKYKQANGFQMVPKEYPPLRRARRLSYILWNVFLEQDTMDVPSGEMQRVLEIHSISKRLEAGLLQLQTINRILQTLIQN